MLFYLAFDYIQIVYDNYIIPGPPTSRGLFPDSGTAGVPLGEDYNISVLIQSNPFPTLTPQSWTFIDYNGTDYDVLPDNVNITTPRGTERLTIEFVLSIIDTRDSNYGNYTLTTGNSYGNMTPAMFAILPRSE